MDNLKNGIAITIGSAFVGMGINYFNLANGLAEGGITGIGLLFKYIWDWDPGITYLVLNIPLVLLGWRTLGRRSFLYTIFGIIMVSAFLYLFRDIRFPMNDLLLASIFAGVTVGVGLGIILRYEGTTGGVEILAQLLHKYLGWSMARSIFVLDSSTILLSLIYLDKQRVMYTVVAVFIGSRVIDFVLEGLNRGKAVFIIAKHTNVISDRINMEIGRGTTLVQGKGGYSGDDREIIYSIVGRSEIGKLKKIVNELDPSAFVIINDVHEVLGEGFKRM